MWEILKLSYKYHIVGFDNSERVVDETFFLSIINFIFSTAYIMLRAHARASFRVRLLLDKRGSPFLTPRVQTASISSSSRLRNNLIASPPTPTVTTTASSRSMSTTHFGESTVRPEPDRVVQDIADYVHDYKIDSDLAWETARLCLIDTIGCGLEGLRFTECRNLLGPVVEGTIVPNGKSVQSCSTFTANRQVGPTHFSAFRN